MKALDRARDALYARPDVSAEPYCIEGGFRFLDPNGRPVQAAPAVPGGAGDPAATLARRWMPPWVKVSPRTGMPTRDGERFDYDVRSKRSNWSAPISLMGSHRDRRYPRNAARYRRQRWR